MKKLIMLFMVLFLTGCSTLTPCKVDTKSADINYDGLSQVFLTVVEKDSFNFSGKDSEGEFQVWPSVSTTESKEGKTAYFTFFDLLDPGEYKINFLDTNADIYSTVNVSIEANKVYSLLVSCKE